jgi:hypothetical protein
VGAELFHADRQTDDWTDMKKLTVALRNFENTPRKIKICKIKLRYNYSIIDFS